MYGTTATKELDDFGEYLASKPPTPKIRERWKNVLNNYLARGCPTIKETKTVEKESPGGLIESGYSSGVYYTFSTSNYIESCHPDMEKAVNWNDQTTEKLNDLYNECSEENWDGYGAEAVSIGTYLEASILLSLLPVSTAQPEIIPEPDGGFGLEWSTENGYIFVISVNGTNVITYAGLFGDNNEVHGAENFNNILPQTILSFIFRLFSKLDE